MNKTFKLNTIENYKNFNNWILSEEIFKKALIEYNNLVKENRAVGTIFLDNNLENIFNKNVDMMSISHKIVNIDIDNFNVEIQPLNIKNVQCKILNIIFERIFEGLSVEKIEPRIRAEGSFVEGNNGEKIIKDGYRIISIDLKVGE